MRRTLNMDQGNVNRDELKDQYKSIEDISIYSLSWPTSRYLNSLGKNPFDLRKFGKVISKISK